MRVRTVLPFLQQIKSSGKNSASTCILWGVSKEVGKILQVSDTFLTVFTGLENVVYKLDKKSRKKR